MGLTAAKIKIILPSEMPISHSRLDKEDSKNFLVISLHGRAERGAYFSRYRGSEIPKQRRMMKLTNATLSCLSLALVPSSCSQLTTTFTN